MKNERNIEDLEIKKYRIFCNEEDKAFPARCRIYQSLIQINNSSKGKKLIKRNGWIRIKNIDTGDVVYRQAQGRSSNQNCVNGFKKKNIEFDYDTKIALGLENSNIDENGFLDCNLNINKTNRMEDFTLHFNHPDDGYRVAYHLGFYGLAAGAAGIILGLIGLAISLIK